MNSKARLGLILIAVVYSRKSVLAPEYVVTVADATGRGVAGVMVRRYVQDYSSGRNEMVRRKGRPYRCSAR